MNNQKTNLDDVLNKFNIFGRYHLQFMGLAVIFYMYGETFSHNYIFAVEESKYTCIEEGFANNTCGSVNGARCSQWSYEDPHSFVAEFELACQEWKRTLVGTAYYFGYMMGLLFLGPLSDRLGRKKSFLYSTVMGAVLGVAKSFSQSYWLYVSLEVLGAMLGDNYLMFYVLNVEMVPTKKRVVFVGLCHLGTAVGGTLLAVAAWSIPYWRHLLLFIYAPVFSFLAYHYLMDESPRWLLAKGKKDAAVAIIEKMSRTNKVELDKDSLEKLSVEIEDSADFSTALKNTIRSRTLLKRCLVCMVWWTTSTFVYHGLMINSVALQGNKYINYCIIQLLHVIGNIITIYILQNYKRKNPMLCSFIASALLCFLQIFLPTGLPWLSVAVYMAVSLVSSVLMITVYMFTSELFPTYTRNSMHALCSSVGRVGAMLAPQTPLLRAYWFPLPTLVFGLASLVAGLATLLVPDTADRALPDTVREVEHAGRTPGGNNIGIHNVGMTTDE